MFFFLFKFNLTSRSSYYSCIFITEKNKYVHTFKKKTTVVKSWLQKKSYEVYTEGKLAIERLNTKLSGNNLEA